MDDYSVATGLFAGAGILTVVITVAVVIFAVVCLWKIFEKAGEPGWAAIIPLYNTYVLFKITWGNGLLFLLCFIPVVNIAVLFITYWKLAKAFGGGALEFLLLILLPVVAYPMLAFGHYEYHGVE